MLLILQLFEKVEKVEKVKKGIFSSIDDTWLFGSN